MEILNEAYFGKTKDVLNIEKAISAFRKKYAKSDNYHIYELDDTDFNAMQKDKLKRNIEKAFEDCFGFGVCELTIYGNVMMNAFTIPVGQRFDTDNRKALIVTPSGYKYDRSADFALIIGCFAGLMCNYKYTDAEVTAILLHEVGHNFSGSVNHRIGILEGVCKTFNFLTAMINLCILNPFPLMVYNNSVAKWLIDFEKKLYKEYPNLMLFKDSVLYWINFYRNLINELNFVSKAINFLAIPVNYINIIINFLLQKVIGMLLYPSRIFHEFYGYSDEKFADQFATMYGYGPELASAMEKTPSFNYGLATQKLFEDNLPILSAMYDLTTFPLMAIITALDPHPANIERLESSIRVLKVEAQYCNPGMRSRLNKDIAILERQRDEYFLSVKAIRRKDQQINPGYFSKSYYAALYGIFGGDMRHHVFDNLFQSNEVLTTKADKEFKKAK